MVAFRPRYSLRTLFVVTTLCAVIAAGVKCERDASREFVAKEVAVASALKVLLPAFDRELFQKWQKDERLNNPTYVMWEHEMSIAAWIYPGVAMISEAGSGEFWSPRYFGSSHEWRIVRSTDSISTDYSKWNAKSREEQVNRVKVTITCTRPCSLISRATFLRIVDNGAPDNKLLIEPLTAALDRAGVRYEIETRPPTRASLTGR